MPALPEWMCKKCLGNFGLCKISSGRHANFYRYCESCNVKLGVPISQAKFKQFGIDPNTVHEYVRSSSGERKTLNREAKSMRQSNAVYRSKSQRGTAWAESYRVYLQSDHWKETRKAALKRALSRCVLCNSGDHLNVHHRTYERRGRELPEDLTVLCGDCHAKFHD